MALINDKTPAADAREPMTNPVLEATEQKIEQQLTPENRQNYMQIVVAGMAAALDKGPNSILASLLKSPDPVRDAARGAVGLVVLLRAHAQGRMPEQAMVPAAMTLMLRALDFVSRAGVVKIAEPGLVRATHVFTNELFAKFHITAQMLQAAAQRVHQITQSPEAMAAINMKAGVTKHPGALEPTPTPPGT